MTNRKYFRRGQRPVFSCGVCKRSTRDTGQGDQLCYECFEIAGMDNSVNDNGWKPGDEGYHANLREAEGLLAVAVSRGGDGDRIRRNNTYLWPTD